MTRTVVGVFDQIDKANAAIDGLTTAGIRREQITLSDAPRADGQHADDDGMLAGVRNFFGSLFGDDDRNTAQYSQAIRLGWTVVKVEADDAQAEVAVDALERSGAVDLEEKASEWRATGWSDGVPAQQRVTTGLQSSDAVIPVVEETLEVGKREVATGGVRVFSRIVETPVSESVELRSEHAEVHRRAVDRPVTAEDVDALGDRTIIVRETAEKAVIAKTARVVEEISVGKTVDHHTQQINETLRSTEVEVERLPAAETSATSAGSLYHDHFKTTFAATGGTYEEYAPAYTYGSALRADPRFAGRDWQTIEPEVRSDWEHKHPGSAWERFKGAVQHAWHKATH